MGWNFAQLALYKTANHIGLPDIFTGRTDNSDKSGQGEFSMSEYSDYVKSIADGNWPSPTITNRSPEHAAVIIENLFRVAKREVCLLTCELSISVYGVRSVIDAAVKFLLDHPQAEIKILAERAIDAVNHPLLSELQAAGVGERVQVKVLADPFREGLAFNFATADGRSFRFEEDKRSCAAIVGFGHEASAARMHHVFARLFEKLK